MTSETVIQHAVDTGIAGTAVTSPLWIQMIAEGLHIYVLAGGAILLTLRCAKAVRDFKGRS